MVHQKSARIIKTGRGTYEKVQPKTENAPCTTALPHFDVADGSAEKCDSAEVQSAVKDESCTITSNDDNHG